MKRIMKFVLAVVLTFTLVGCGGSGNSTDAQEKVVNEFFEYLKKGEIDKLNKLGTKGYADDLGFEDITSVFEEYLDEDEYGKTFVKEAQKFIDVVFENFISEHKVKSVKEDGDETVIVVTGKRLDETALDSSDMEDEVSDYMLEYMEENKDAIQKVYEEKGQEAAMAQVMADVATDLFKMMSDKVKEADSVDFTLEFTLVEEKDSWLIDKVNEKDSKSSTSKKDEDKKDEDTDKDDSTYSVDKSKLKASATLLKKGRLEDNEYLADKYEKTDLEFIDYNVTNGAGQEIDKYDFIDTSSGTLKFETEIHGNKGSKVIITIKDDRNQLAKDEYTLEDTKQIFTKEVTGIDVAAKYFTINIYVADSYDAEYDFGDKVGTYFISKDE